MIIGFICDCGGAERLLRKVLSDANVNNWLDIPVYKGKARFQEFYNSCPEEYKNTLEMGALNQYITNASKYTVVLGMKNGHICWADSSHGDVKSRLDAQVICERFAEK